MMKTLKKQASTFLTHLFGLEDERQPVERFRSMDDDDIRPMPADGPGTASRRTVQRMRPSRDSAKEAAERVAGSIAEDML